MSSISLYFVILLLYSCQEEAKPNGETVKNVTNDTKKENYSNYLKKYVGKTVERVPDSDPVLKIYLHELESHTDTIKVVGEDFIVLKSRYKGLINSYHISQICLIEGW